MTNDAANAFDALLRDPLSVAREAECPVGYVGLDIAEDVLAAPSICAVHLPWDHKRRTPAADRWLEDSFPGWARSMLEDWLDGRFDFMQSVAFTRGDDTSQRLYYYVCELQRRGKLAGPRPVIFDVARIPRESSAAWTCAGVRRLAADLGLDDEALEEGIRVANRRRDALREADKSRGLPGPYYERLARASLFAPAEQLPLEQASAETGKRGRVLLAGSSPPDDSLHRAVDEAGWAVAGELYDRNLLRLGPAVDEQGGAPAERIGAGVLAAGIGSRSFGDRAASVAAAVEERDADAVVYWLHEEDEAIAWDVVGASRGLHKRGIPTLVMARRRWDLADAPDEELRQFLGGIDA